MNKQIARALVLKNFTEAKGLIFGSLYAKSSLAMDEARYEITKSMFNTPEESEEIIEEETEQLDELSPELLGRYIKKASVNLSTNSWDAGRKLAVKPGDQTERGLARAKTNASKNVHRLTKRTRGIAKATDKLTNRIKEETEQLDELSPELLGRYMKKANRRAQSAAETIHAELSKPLYQQNNTTKDVAADELIRRTRGIHRATARIVPKTIGEETEQLDEVRRTDTQHPNDRAEIIHRRAEIMHRLKPRMLTVVDGSQSRPKSSEGYIKFFNARAKKQGRPLTDDEHKAIRRHTKNHSMNIAKRSAIR